MVAAHESRRPRAGEDKKQPGFEQVDRRFLAPLRNPAQAVF
jgi:hypothetical protein